MKTILLFIGILLGYFTFTGSVYDFKINTPNGGAISLANYKGKKIVFAVSKPENLQLSKLRFLDSLQGAKPNIQIIVIPATDFSAGPIISLVNTIQNTISSRLILSVPLKVLKANGANQDPLMQWLTFSDKNSHFNDDINTDDQLYIVSESGILYSVLEKGAPVNAIGKILSQPDVRQ